MRFDIIEESVEEFYEVFVAWRAVARVVLSLGQRVEAAACVTAYFKVWEALLQVA